MRRQFLEDVAGCLQTGKQSHKVELEVQGDLARIDLLVISDDFVLGIEVKTWSKETKKDQTRREWSDLKDLGRPKAAALLLAPTRLKPSSPNFSSMTFRSFAHALDLAIADRFKVPANLSQAWIVAWYSALSMEIRRY